MAISVVHTTSGSVDSDSVTIPATTAGNCLVVCIDCLNSGGGQVSISAVTLGGSAGNFSQAVAGHEEYESVYSDVFIWVDPDCAGGQTAVAVTASPADVHMVTVYEISGVAASSVVDQTSDDGGTSASWSSGATATTTQASEIWIGTANASNGISAGPGSPWTNTAPDSVDISGYQIVSSTGTATYSGTQSPAGAAWAAAVATLKGQQTVTSTGAVDLNASVSATGAETFTASGAVTLTENLSASGSEAFTSSGSVSLNPTVAGTGAVSTAYTDVVLQDDPTFLWLLNETSGTTANDSSGNGNTGTYLGTYTQGAAGPLFQADAVELDAAGEVGQNGSAAAAPGTLSIEIWFNTTTVSQTICGFNAEQDGSSATEDRCFIMGPQGQISFYYYTVAEPGTPGVYADGNWHHIVGTYDKSTGVISIYMDGALVQSATGTTTPYEYDGYWVAGEKGSSSESFTGTLAAFAVYPTALSAARVEAHYAAGVPVSGTGAVDLNASVSGTASTPYTSSGGVKLNPSVAGTGAETFTGTAAVDLNPSVSGTATGGNTTTSGAVSLNLSVAGTGGETFTGTAAVDLNPSVSGTGGEGFSSHGTVSLNQATAGTGAIANPVTTSGTVTLNPSIAAVGYYSTGLTTTYQWDGTAWVPYQWDGSQSLIEGSVTGTQLAAATITGDLIADGTITAGNIESGTITATQIAAETITGDLIAASTITGDNIAGDTITGDNIAGETITAGNIESGTITSTQLAADSVTADQIAANAVTAGTIAAGAINGQSITAVSIGSSFLSATDINGGTITADQIIIEQGMGNTLLVYSQTTTATTYTSGSGYWTAPSGTQYAMVECGGGGAGGGAGETSGGGGGEYAAELYLAVTAGDSYAYSVGSGGAGASGTGASGAGGNTTFTGDAVTVTAHGAPSVPYEAGQGQGGTGSSNSVHFNGGNGGASGSTAGTGGGGGGASAGTTMGGGNGGNASGTSGGAGGSAPTGGGAGGAGGSDTGNGTGGSAPGGGGGGAGSPSSGSLHTGGAGAAGKIVVTAVTNTLIGSIASESGSDSYGNSYPQGILTDALEVTGTVTATGGTPSSPTVVTTDSWNELSLTGDWEGSGSGVNGFYYKLLTSGDVALIWDVKNTNSNPGTLGTLPSGYLPYQSVGVDSGWQGTGPSSYNDEYSPALSVASDGAITGLGLYVSGLRLFGSFIMPLVQLPPA